MKYRNDMFDLTMILAIMLMAIFALLCYVYTFTSIGSFIGCVLSVIVPISVMIQLIDSMDEDTYEIQEDEV